MPWQLSRTGATIDLPDSFNLEEYRRETAFAQNTLNGEETVIDSESIHGSAYEITLTGIIKGSDAADALSKLNEIEDVATPDADDLTLTHDDISGISYTIQHVRSRSRRGGAGLLNVTLTFLTNYTRL